VEFSEGVIPAVKLRALAGRLLQAVRIWSGQHPDRPARMTRGEPAVLRVIAPLALLILVATVICTGFGFVLAWQADNSHEAERRQSLAAAVEALRAASPDRVRGDPESVQAIERMSGLKGLRFETEPVRGDRDVQVRQREQGPGLRALEDGTVQPAVELLEEVGEVATEIQFPPVDKKKLQKELIQAAAVAVAWAESLEDES